MMFLRNGSAVEDHRLDRLPSKTMEHVDKYPLRTPLGIPQPQTSMVIGVNWYSNFDRPVKTGFTMRGRSYWTIGDGDLGSIRGGHAVCLRNYKVRDSVYWWKYYNQGTEGRCVEFATKRAATQANRKRYDITSKHEYHEMQRFDEWEGGSYPGASPVYEGTSVRAGLEIAVRGLIPARRGGVPVSVEEAPSLMRAEEGFAAYRWATSWDDVRTVLGVPDWMPGVPMNNSWGEGYPREVLLMDAAGERLLREDGEFGVVTDR